MEDETVEFLEKYGFSSYIDNFKGKSGTSNTSKGRVFDKHVGFRLCTVCHAAVKSI